VGVLRDAGIKRVDELLRDAMLNPELARALLEKVPAKPDTGGAARIIWALRKAALAGAAVGGTAVVTKQAETPPEPPPVSAKEVFNALAPYNVTTANALAAAAPISRGNALVQATVLPRTTEFLRAEKNRTQAPPPSSRFNTRRTANNAFARDAN
jgi:hypothetical protein